jgi:hypothetical protein
VGHSVVVVIVRWLVRMMHLIGSGGSRLGEASSWFYPNISCSTS